MAGETIITVVGNLVADPELRFTGAGAAVCNFRIASTPRTFDKQANEWRDGEGLFLACSVWREQAENAAQTLAKGMRVIVQGRLTQRNYETQQGEKRTVVELQVDEVGPSLRHASATVTRTPRQGNGQAGFGGSAGSASFGAPIGGGNAPADDPWATSGPAQSASGRYGNEQPPF